MACIFSPRTCSSKLTGIPRSLRGLRRAVRIITHSRSFANGDVPPLNEPLPNMPAPPPNVVHGHVLKETRHGTQVTTLENGIRVASEESFGQFSTVGVLIDAGSRHEADYPSGVTHVIEKLAYQSTQKFGSNDEIAGELEKYGGMADCSTFRDCIVYATSAFTSGLPTIIEVLSEAVLQPKLLEKEVEEQKTVVQFELENLEYRPDPEPVLTDLIHSAAYRDNTLGLPKLCPPENLPIINSATIKSFMQRYYVPSRMVVAGVNVDHEELVRLTRKFFMETRPVWHEEGATIQQPDKSLAQYTGGIIKDHRTEPRINPGPTPLPDLAHISIGLETVPYDEPDFFAFTVLNTLMGGGGSFSAGGPGKGMYSRLYLNVLNRYHWIYSATAYHHSYSDSGLFCIHASAHPSQLADLVQVIMKEYFSLSVGAMHEEEVARAKKQLQSMLMMNLESRVIVFEDIGRQVLGLGLRKPPQELFESIDCRYKDFYMPVVSSHTPNSKSLERAWSRGIVDRTKEYSFVLSTMPRLHACSMLLDLEAVTLEDIRRVSEKMLASKPAVAAYGNLTALPNMNDIQFAFMDRKGVFSKAMRLFQKSKNR